MNKSKPISFSIVFLIAIVIVAILLFAIFIFKNNKLFNNKTNNLSVEKPTNFITDVTELQVRDKIGDWTIEKIQPYSNLMSNTSFLDNDFKKINNSNVSINFSGNVEITGTYKYEYSAFGDLFILLFYITKPSEIVKIPYVYDQESANDIEPDYSQPKLSIFYLDKEKYSKLLNFPIDEKPHSGTVKVKVTHYYLNDYPSEVYDYATISEVLEIYEKSD